MKRIISVVLTVVMLLAVIPLNSLTAFAASTAIISIENVSATPDSTVDVSISISGNPGIASIGFALTFDEELTLIGASNGEAFSELTMTPPAQLKKVGYVTGSCRFAWLGNENTTDNGTILNLTFSVSANAELNKDCQITVTCDHGDVLDESRSPVDVEVKNGKVTIIDYTPGDIDGDGNINMLDVLTLCQYYVDGCKYDPNGYGVDIKAECGDVDANGKINMLDVLMICQYYVDGCKYDPDGYAVKLLPGKPSCQHVLVKTDEVVPTCTEDGNIEYWHCEKCGEYFSDANAENVISFESTIVKAKGHTVVIDEAVAPTYDEYGWTEGSHCSVCDTVIVAQERLEKLPTVSHSITYRNLKGANTPEPSYYYEHLGLIELPEIEADGYIFDGWYTSTIDPQSKVDYIPANSSNDYVLYAWWTPVTYSITYKDAPKNENPLEYNIETKTIVLNDPSWPGLMFVNWVDKDNNIVTSIEQGTIGDIQLTATWKRLRNIATPANDSDYIAIYDEETEKYIFVYQIGTIEHVVLEELQGSQYLKYNSQASDLTFSLTSTVELAENYVNSIATTVSQSVSNSVNWSQTTDKIKTISNTNTLGGEIDIGKDSWPIKAAIKYEHTWLNSETDSVSNTVGGSNSSNSSTSETASSTVGYNKVITSSIAETITIDKESPKGYYAYTHAGSIRVYAIVSFDPVEERYDVNTFSVLDNMHEIVLYYRDVNEMNSQSVETLSFDIPLDDIKAYIDLSYYVSFDANGGSGKMDQQIIARDSYIQLTTNKFIKNGYKFSGWIFETETNQTIFQDEQQVYNIAECGKHITLKAMWSACDYKINYNLNSADIKEVPILNASSKPVTFDSSFVLDVPICNGFKYYKFKGWYTAETGGEQLTDSNGNSLSKWTYDHDMTVYAQWEQTYASYTYISSPTEFESLRSNTAGKYMLIQDIDFSGSTWTPITSFSGELNGNGYKIIGLTYQATLSDSTNTFGFIRTLKGTIKDVTFSGITIDVHKYHDTENYFYLGGVCGILDGGTISNVKILGDSKINGYHDSDDTSRKTHAYVGGFAGQISSGTISNCSITNSSVYGKARINTNTNCTADAWAYVGGIVGHQAAGNVNNCVRDEFAKIVAYTLTGSKSSAYHCHSGGITGYKTSGQIVAPYSSPYEVFDSVEAVGNRYANSSSRGAGQVCGGGPGLSAY